MKERGGVVASYQRLPVPEWQDITPEGRKSLETRLKAIENEEMNVSNRERRNEQKRTKKLDFYSQPVMFHSLCRPCQPPPLTELLVLVLVLNDFFLVFSLLFQFRKKEREKFTLS